MTSWISMKTPVRQLSSTPTFYFRTRESGLCSDFNHFIFSFIYAQKNAESLYVFDKPNCVSANFPLFETILNSNAAIKYLKEPATSQNINDKISQTSPILANMKVNKIQEIARSIFQLNGNTLGRIRERMEKVNISKKPFDLGIHIRSGDKITTKEMGLIPIKNYIESAKKIQKKLGKKTLEIFIMTDNYSLLQEFKKSADPTWNIFSFCPSTPYFQNGHVQLEYNLLPLEQRTDLFYLFLTELFVMQNIPNLIVTFSSNVGRFLFLTNRVATTPDSIISLDVPSWSPF